jgi:predicted metalloprotease
MSFKPGAELDPGQVRDIRGRRGATGLAVGGGGVGLILVLVYVLLGGNPGDLEALGDLNGQAIGPDNTTLVTECQTGADANEREDCRIVGYVNSIQAYWADALPASGTAYTNATTVLFTEGVSTACGAAGSAVGPFYCPGDQQIYLDLGFFEALKTQLGATGGDFAEAYVVSHEYGHHVQDLIGVLERGDGGTGADSSSVRLELMADCLAGVWSNHAAATGFLEPLGTADIAEALDAAAAVGDDRIQEAAEGRVNPETWTHGSSEQRQEWFSTGYERGALDSCDTFATTP